jgi:hypothetical protein
MPADPNPIDVFRGPLQRLAEPGRDPGPDSLPAGALAALSDGGLDGEARELAVEHLARCAHCRANLSSLVRALADPPVAHEVGRVDSRRRDPFLHVAVPLAAAAILLLVVWPRQLDDRRVTEAGHRAPTITAAPEPSGLWPIGPVAGASSLRWEAVPAADLYRVSLFDAKGRVLYESQLTDTVAPLPDSITLVAGLTYLWKVEARTGWDRWSGSPLVEFSLASDTTR